MRDLGVGEIGIFRRRPVWPPSAADAGVRLCGTMSWEGCHEAYLV